MGKTGFIDITAEPKLYIFEKRAGKYGLLDTKNFSCSKDYDFSFSVLPDDIGEFYLSLPLHALNFRLIELPFSDREKILSVLPFELDGFILNGADSVILDGIILGTNEGKSRVLAVYLGKSVLDKIIKRLGAFNIDPKVVTSVELRHIMNGFNPERLLNPVDMSPEERISAVTAEIGNNLTDFRRGEFSYTKDTEKIKKYLRLTAILGIAAVSLFALSVTLKAISARNEISAIQGDMRKIYSEVFPEDKKITAELYQFKSRMKELKDKEAYLVGVSPLQLLHNISGLNRGSVVLNEIVIDKERVILRGDAASFAEIQQMKEALGAAMNEVSISDSKTSSQGRVIFTITAREKKG